MSPDLKGSMTQCGLISAPPRVIPQRGVNGGEASFKASLSVEQHCLEWGGGQVHRMNVHFAWLVVKQQKQSRLGVSNGSAWPLAFVSRQREIRSGTLQGWPRGLSCGSVFQATL